jgi:hypothetical protein
MATSFGSSCRCTRLVERLIAADWPASTESASAVTVRRACIGCGKILAPADGGFLDSDYRARLWGREQVGKRGDWQRLGLPSMRRIGAGVGPASLVTQVAKSDRFFKYDWENLADADLFGSVRSRLGLGRGWWPRAVMTPAWSQPVIDHHGLAEKFARKRDNSHLHLVSLACRTIASPVEAWIDEYDGSSSLYLLARYRIGGDVVAHMACVDTRTNLCTTIYHHDPDGEQAKRRGLFQYAAWAAPS